MNLQLGWHNSDKALFIPAEDESDFGCKIHGSYSILMHPTGNSVAATDNLKSVKFLIKWKVKMKNLARAVSLVLFNSICKYSLA